MNEQNIIKGLSDREEAMGAELKALRADVIALAQALAQVVVRTGEVTRKPCGEIWDRVKEIATLHARRKNMTNCGDPTGTFADLNGTFADLNGTYIPESGHLVNPIPGCVVIAMTNDGAFILALCDQAGAWHYAQRPIYDVKNKHWGSSDLSPVPDEIRIIGWQYLWGEVP
jgi:hypothetical protein